jgi:hypothetical protein
MNTNSRPKRPFNLIATATVIASALAAFVVPTHSSANSDKVDGVRAQVKRGTLEVKGGDQANAVALRLQAGEPNRIQVDVGDNGSADRSFASDDVAAIKVKTGDGNDTVRVDDENGGFTGDSRPTTIAGGDGNDSLQGAQAVPGQAVPPGGQNEKYKGGDGNDTVDGGRGNDTAYLGGGNDSFRWDPGEGSDAIEGQDDTDAMLFNGAGAPAVENVTMTAHGGRLTFFRTPGNVTMDTDDVETVDFNALGGTDNVTVDDLTGTDVTRTNLDLAGALGGNVPDGAVDNVVVNGTNGDDTIDIRGNGSGADVSGLATAVSVEHADPTDPADRLSVDTRAGTDNVTTNGVAGVLQVLVDGDPV